MRNNSLTIISIAIFVALFTNFCGIAQIKESEIYEKAVSLDKQKRHKEAIKYYKKYLSLHKENAINEKVQLRIARITQNFDESISEYKLFINNYQKSRYRFLARYELATLYKIKGNYNEALKEFYEISYLTKGTPYWQKSLLEAADIEIELYNFDKAIVNLYNVLEEIEDYEDIARTYFLLGMTGFKQKEYNDAEQFFLICAGNFPLSSAAISSLFELIKIHIINKNYGYAKKIQAMIEEMYPDSPQNHEARLLVKEYKNIPTSEQFIEIELNSEDNQKIKQKTLARLREDLRLSNNEFVINENNIKTIKSGLYIQLGYYSDINYAHEYIKQCEKKGIDDLFVSKTISSTSGNTHYRILLGPISKDKSNEMLIDLKDKNIEAIILELTVDYD